MELKVLSKYISFFFLFTDATFMCWWGPIPIAMRCDGNNNCGDNADEENCPKGKTPMFYNKLKDSIFCSDILAYSLMLMVRL